MITAAPALKKMAQRAEKILLSTRQRMADLGFDYRMLRRVWNSCLTL
jgi:hypothetical protein